MKNPDHISRSAHSWYAANQPPRNHNVDRCHACRVNGELICEVCLKCAACCGCEYYGIDGKENENENR